MTTNFVGWVSILARRHANPLAAVAVREGLHRIDAVDAVQEAFSTLLGLPQARELAMDDEGALCLMSVMVRNAARNMRRRHHRARPHAELDAISELPSDAPSAEELLAAAEAHVALSGCVNQLAKIQRHVLTMRVFEELSPAQSANQLGLAPRHVAVLLHRARQALLECIELGKSE